MVSAYEHSLELSQDKPSAAICERRPRFTQSPESPVNPRVAGFFCFGTRGLAQGARLQGRTGLDLRQRKS